MADAFTIIGTTSAILDFTDYAWKFVRTTGSIYGSISGRTLENERLDVVATKMAELSGTLEKADAVQPRSDEELRIATLAAQCNKLCKIIVDLLKKTTAEKKHSLLHCTRAAMKTVWTKETVADLQGQLTLCTTQLNVHITTALRYEPKASTPSYELTVPPKV